MNYGIRLRQLRERVGYTQIEVATLLGLGNSAYCVYETEYQTIPLKHLNELANIYNVSIDYLLGFTDTKQYSNSTKEITKEKVGERLKEIRKELKLTQGKLGTILNTTQSVIADYERGRYLIATPFLYTICNKYKISADYLLGKVEEPKYLIKK